MADGETHQYRYLTLYLPRWEVEIPAAREGNVLYFPVSILCEVIGVDKRTQVKSIKGDSRLSKADALRDIPFLSSVGWRNYLSIRKKECSLWISGIDPARCKISTRGPLQEFQEDLMDEAERLLFNAAPRVPEGQRGSIQHAYRVEIRMACLDCGAPHLIIIENGNETILRAPRAEVEV